jgi:8-amino-7-oxononanoate synthase
MEGALEAGLAALGDAGLLRTLRPLERGPDARVRTADGRRAVDFASNDYLGLATDPRVAEAAARALRDEGTGAAAARLISGDHPLHRRLEEALAAWKGAEDALLFPSGYAANVGGIPALVGPGDAVYSDALNHASLIDGCRLSRARIRVFPHADIEGLDRMLTDDAGRYRRRLIVSDTVFSMDGDLQPLDRLVEVVRRHGAWSWLDDAHGTGVLGASGRGAVEHWGVEGRVDAVMGTLGKALGVSGAFVAGSARLRAWLLNRARSFVFTTAPPPPLAAAALRSLEIACDEPWRRERVRAVAASLRAGLAALGHPAPGRADAHVVPVPLGSAEAAVRIGRALLERGFVVGAVRPPTVPEGSSRLRVTASAAHRDDDVRGLLEALRAELPAPCSSGGPPTAGG